MTQVPTIADFTARASTFGNHMSGIQHAVRGGDLMIRYPDGTLRNLTREAGFGQDGFQGGNNAIAVREPTVHWSGTKAIFSMIRGGPTEQNSQAEFFWQLYEVTGLGQGQTAVITKVPNQPANYNNISPLYAATSDRILFTSDRPRNGQAHLHPSLDEYESSPTVTGIWSLDPANANSLTILNHTPSGAFSPFIDSFGRVIFTRWDHLQRDQQRDAEGPTVARNYVSEASGAAFTGADVNSEMFPELRLDEMNMMTPYGRVGGHRFNIFTPWQMNDDGTEEETLNHVGRHELNFGFTGRTFLNDPNLSENTDDSNHANQVQVGTDGGLFHMREDPLNPGEYYGIAAREFGSLTTNKIIKLSGAPTLNGDQMRVVNLTAPDGGGNTSPGGRFRNPVPLTSGRLLATHTPATEADPNLMQVMRLKLLNRATATSLYDAGADSSFLTPGNGIVKSVTWFNPNNFSDHPSFSGPLWEMEAVEVVARTRPGQPPAMEPPAPELSVFAQQNVDIAAFKSWMAQRDLALIVSRNVTSRDDADVFQPLNLKVPGGVESRSAKKPNGTVYNVANLQIMQADQIRGYSSRGGRRNIAQPLHDLPVQNPNPGVVPGSVKIGLDGSTAAFVPARRALTWQLTDPQGEPIVRERMWLTMQPGEVRVCATCHGSNEKDQAGRAKDAAALNNPPEALRQLLTAWKQMPGAQQSLSNAQALKKAPVAAKKK